MSLDEMNEWHEMRCDLRDGAGRRVTEREGRMGRAARAGKVTARRTIGRPAAATADPGH